MSRGLLARLRFWSSPPDEGPVASGEEEEVAVAEVSPLPEPEPPPAAVAAPAAAEGPGRAPARPLPPFRPVSSTDESAAVGPEAEPSPPLSITLSEAIELVHEAGGDAMELRFLRRELQRRGGEGSEPPELWSRTEKAVAGRLRRVGRLADGQVLELTRDP
jgi:hypothetical protein